MSEETKPRPAKGPTPDYNLSALDKVTSQRAQIGAGWKNEDGSISIRLNLCTFIHHNPNLVLTLFPNTYKRGSIPFPPLEALNHENPSSSS